MNTEHRARVSPEQDTKDSLCTWPTPGPELPERNNHPRSSSILTCPGHELLTAGKTKQLMKYLPPSIVTVLIITLRSTLMLPCCCDVSHQLHSSKFRVLEKTHLLRKVKKLSSCVINKTAVTPPSIKDGNKNVKTSCFLYTKHQAGVNDHNEQVYPASD